jgi:hypothetical protein
MYKLSFFKFLENKPMGQKEVTPVYPSVSQSSFLCHLGQAKTAIAGKTCKEGKHQPVPLPPN